MSKFSISRKEIAGSLVILAFAVLPFVSMGKSDKIYVDDDASGSQTGSESHPYKTIEKALDEADKKDEVHIRKGTYEENIEIPEYVKVYGSGEDEVIIKADHKDEPVVKMNDNAKIDGVTIRKGKYGISVGKNDEASITQCTIEDNYKDGIHIKEAPADDKNKVSISESTIKDNGRDGIYSEKRRIILIDNEIIGNRNDGVDLAAGSRAWIEGNKMKDNRGSGMKLILDRSYTWTKNNTYYGNKREGLEVNSFGGSGKIDINKSKFYKNSRYGVAKVQRGGSSSVWSGLTFQGNNKFWQNISGNISSVMSIK